MAHQHRFATQISRLEVRRHLNRLALKVTPPPWKSYRESQYGKAEFEYLAFSLGSSRRCEYCRNSRACDIEHFYPKAPFPFEEYNPRNHLLICTECNRKKGDKFPTMNGVPLLFNPRLNTLWDGYHYIPETGMISPRINPARNAPLSWDATLTLEVLPTLNYESCAQERQLFGTRVTEECQWFLRRPSNESFLRLKRAMESDYTLVSFWYLAYEPRAGHPFHSLKELHPREHRRLLGCKWPGTQRSYL